MKLDPPLNQDGLTAWGWDPAWEDAAAKILLPGEAAGRVTAVFRERCLVELPDGERAAEVAGRFRHEAQGLSNYPVVGDWAVVKVADTDLAIIHRLLPRRNALSRKAAGSGVAEQVLAANVNLALVVTAHDEDFNPRRIERYVVMARQAGMAPVVIINKCDLANAAGSL